MKKTRKNASYFLCPKNLRSKFLRILITIFVIALIALTGCEGLLTSETINIEGNSELSFDPDEAEVWAGISVVKLTADDAQWL